jgi:hypothetical protein
MDCTRSLTKKPSWWTASSDLCYSFHCESLYAMVVLGENLKDLGPLDVRVATFFSRRAHRFLLFLIAGAATTLFGTVAGYREPGGDARHVAGVSICICCFAIYTAATFWDGHRTTRGTWRIVWLNALTRIEAAHIHRTKKAAPLPISGFTATIAFLFCPTGANGVPPFWCRHFSLGLAPS